MYTGRGKTTVRRGGSFLNLPSPYLLLACILFLVIIYQFYKLLSLSQAQSTLVKDNLSHKRSRLIFSINSGRVGTGYIAALLNTAKGVSALHEPDPVMVGTYVKLINIAPMNESYVERKIKVSAVQSVLDSMPPGEIYAESNSNFIRTFYDVVMNEFMDAEIDVIILRRYLPDVLKSLLELGHFNGNPATANWIPEITSPNRAFTSCKTADDMDAYDHLITYLLDTEARAQRFKVQFKDATNLYSVVEVRQEELTTMEGTLKFFKQLRLESTVETERFIEEQKKINRRAYVKSKYNIKTTLEICIARIEEYLAVCKKKGIKVPDLPQLQRIPIKYDD